MFVVDLTAPIQIPSEIGGAGMVSYDRLRIDRLAIYFRNSDRYILAQGGIINSLDGNIREFPISISIDKSGNFVEYQLDAPGDGQREVREVLSAGQITAKENFLNDTQSAFIDALLALGTIVGAKVEV
jgi:hypothetical protein